jgi:membrane protease YdiL (CAAX protease family)
MPESTTSRVEPTPATAPDAWPAWELAGVVAVGVVPPYFGNLDPEAGPWVAWVAEFGVYPCCAVTALAYVRRGGRAGWLGLAAFLLLQALGALVFYRAIPLDELEPCCGLLYDAAIALTVLVFISRPPARWREHGLVRPHWVTDLALGAALFLGVRLAWQVLSGGWLAWPPSPGVPPEGWALLVLRAATTGAVEELVMRAYLIPRLEGLARSKAAAVALTSALFALWHWNQGPLALVSHFLLGVAAGVMFCRTRRFAPVAFGHFLLDFYPERLLGY